MRLNLLCVLLGVLGAVAGGLAQPALVAPGEVLVRLRSTAAKATADSLLHQTRLRYGIEAPQALFTGGAAAKSSAAGLAAWVRMRFSGEADPAEVAAALEAAEAIETAVPNFVRRLTQDDSLRAQQWGLDAIGWAGDKAEGTVIGVIDSGLDRDHPDIAGAVWVNPAEAAGASGVDDDGNGYVDDLNGWDFTDAPGLPGVGDYLGRDAAPDDESSHGTHVSGIAAALAGNGSGIAGVAAGAKVMVLRAGFNLRGGSFLQDDDIAAALVYAADNGADVVNMSFGDPRYSPLLEAAVDYAVAAGCVLVAATGNDGLGRVYYPARFDPVIAVGASGRRGEALAFSNGGPALDLLAPGDRVLSLVPGGGYGERSGTSMAAPHVAGVAALIRSRRPEWTATQVRAALVEGAGEPWDIRRGAGGLSLRSLGIQQAGAGRIAAPTSGEAVDGTVQIVVENPPSSPAAAVELSWGRSSAPIRWNALEAGENGYEWSTAGLAAGTYVLRARWGLLEDRVAVEVGPVAGAVSGLKVVRVLQGGAWTQYAFWERPRPAEQELAIYAGGADLARWRLAIPRDRLHVWQRLPDDLEAGAYEVRVGDERASFAVDPIPLRQVPATRLAVWPAGYFMPQLSDFDRDGLVEAVQMAEAGGGYGRVEFYEFGFSPAPSPPQVHATSRLFIPWNLQDADADGLPEIMAVDNRRVRLLEAPEPGAFPSEAVWQAEGVWGGEAGDLDGDGRTELLLRGADAPLLQIFEHDGDNSLRAAGALANDTAGDNDLSERQVLGDFDGNGRPELAVGDADGDLLLYGAALDDAWRTRWRLQERRDTGAVRLLGAGDFDGDGRVELAVGRYLQPDFSLEERRWTVTVYQADDDGALAAEWETQVWGGQPAGNGLVSADVDGDGVPEIVLALVPDLYVFEAEGIDRYRVLWHHSIEQSYHPASGDLNGDGRAELVFNSEAGASAWALEAVGVPLPAPAGLAAYGTEGGAVQLRWSEVPGATAYRVWRDGQTIAEAVQKTSFSDSGGGEAAEYRVAALNGLEPGQSAAARVERSALDFAPRRVERLGSKRLGVWFDAPVEVPFEEAYRIGVEPLGVRAQAAFSDRGGVRLVLAFANALPDTGAAVLRFDGVEGPGGRPVADFSFELAPFVAPTRLVEAAEISSSGLTLRFSGPIGLPDATGFGIKPAGPRIVGVASVGDDALRLDFDPQAPLEVIGRPYRFELLQVLDAAGRKVEGELLVAVAPQELASVTVYPNPFRPARGNLTLAGIPLGAEVEIYSTDGRLLRRLREEDGDGGVEWDGTNQAGRAVAAGVLYYRAHADNVDRLGTFVLLRP